MRIKYSLFIMLFVFISNFMLSCQEDDKEAKNIVNNYLREQLAVRVDNYYSVQDYFHPDLAFPPGENQFLHVVNTKYSIVNVQKKILNINLMEPKDEEITIVTVLFKRYCDIYNSKFISADEKYTRDYYLSKSTGKLLILDFDNPPEKTATLDNAIQWAFEMKDKSSKWNDLYNKLIELQKTVDKNSK